MTADIAREAARETDGKFGTQEHAKPARGLEESEADFNRRLFLRSIESPMLPEMSERNRRVVEASLSRSLDGLDEEINTLQNQVPTSRTARDELEGEIERREDIRELILQTHHEMFSKKHEPAPDSNPAEPVFSSDLALTSAQQRVALRGGFQYAINAINRDIEAMKEAAPGAFDGGETEQEEAISNAEFDRHQITDLRARLFPATDKAA